MCGHVRSCIKLPLWHLTQDSYLSHAICWARNYGVGSLIPVLGYVAYQCESSHSSQTVLTELFRDEGHTAHVCEDKLCPISCQLCSRLCIGDHLHGLSANENHLCGYARFFISPTTLFTWTSSEEHSCSALCSADGICQIDTTPMSIEATFIGRHENFQYTKVSACLSMRLLRFLQGILVYSECVI